MLRIIFAAAPIGIGMTKNRIISWANERIPAMVGYSEKELIGKNARLLYETDEDYERVGREKYADIEKYGSGTIETRWKCKDGQVIDILLSSSPLDRSDLSAGVIFTALDITARKQAEERLRLVQFAIDHSSDVAHWMDKDANFVYVNDSACKVLGYTHEELGKMSVFDIDPDFKPEMWLESWRLLKQNGSIIIETRHKTKNGKIIPVEIVANYMDFGGKEYNCAFARDITERKAAERELEKSREVYRALAENSPDVIIRYDRQMKCVYANQACKSVLNLYTDDIIGKVPTEMNYDKNKTAEVEKRIRQVFSTGKPFQAEAELEGKEGKLIFDLCMIPEFASSGEVETVLATGRDITETKRLQEFTSRAMRLETAGRIAGQVAHDFNNLLGPLMAYPDLITDTLPAQHEALPLIDDMRQAAEQIAEINQQLLTLGRRGHYNLQPLNLNKIVDQIIGDIFPAPETLIIEKNLAADLMNINAGGSQILRALSNLISNARDAMQDIGYLTVTTENFYVDDAALGFGHIPAGEYIKLTITDTGSGMSGDVLARIFEPFYTTKTATRKRGSGLGLSVVHAVYLYFPITREEAEKPQTDRIVTGSESILVVDDDKIQRDVTLMLLKRLGYDAAVAENGEKALRLLSEKRFDLLILDMVMRGGMDGTATYMEALKINPDQKAIIVSGYAESERVSRALNLGVGAFHKKPLMLKTLSQAIRKELDKPIRQPKSV
jgi:PAS domain S-box-containing protein